MRFLLGMMVVWMGCGGDGSSPTIDAPASASLDDRARACAILGACLGYSTSQCIAALDLTGTAGEIACVLEKTVTDCIAVRACVGQRITPDPTCTPGCADGDTVVRCNGGQRIETDCTLSLEPVGPSCVVNGRVDCGGAACTVDGEYTCAGATSSVCDSGITEVTACDKLGLECVPRAPRCVGPAAGTCTAGTAATCDGDVLVTCDEGTLRRQDCTRYGGRTCVAGTCAHGSECPIGSSATCSGTTLEMCLAGVRKSIDCTTIGATTCAGDHCL